MADTSKLVGQQGLLAIRDFIQAQTPTLPSGLMTRTTLQEDVDYTWAFNDYRRDVAIPAKQNYVYVNYGFNLYGDQVQTYTFGPHSFGDYYQSLTLSDFNFSWVDVSLFQIDGYTPDLEISSDNLQMTATYTTDDLTFPIKYEYVFTLSEDAYYENQLQITTHLTITALFTENYIYISNNNVEIPTVGKIINKLYGKKLTISPTIPLEQTDSLFVNFMFDSDLSEEFEIPDFIAKFSTSMEFYSTGPVLPLLVFQTKDIDLGEDVLLIFIESEVDENGLHVIFAKNQYPNFLKFENFSFSLISKTGVVNQ